MYSSQIIDSAARALSQRRQQALSTADRRREELHHKIPRLQQIERRLAELGAGVAKAALSGGDVTQKLEELRRESLLLQQEQQGLLLKAGLAVNFLEPPFACALCQDTGYQNGRRCPCMEALIKAEAYKTLPAPGHLREFSFGSFSLEFYPTEAKDGRPSPRRQMAEVLEKCRDYAEQTSNGGESLLLLGRTGLGKTHLSLAIASRAMERGLGVVYSSTQELIDRAERDKFGRDSTGEDGQFLRYALGCDLLILDDLGSEFAGQLSAAVLFHVVNTRLMERRCTIISTNLSPDELQQKYSERLISRMLCAYTILPFAGDDIRMLKSLAKHR